MKSIFILLIFSFICGVTPKGLIARQDQSYLFEKVTFNKMTLPEDEDLRSTFLLLCDSIVDKIKDVKTGNDYFIDSYGVRALCVAYDLTGRQKYLDACISWSKRMAGFQEKMIPAGVYYMNYERKPGEVKGDWFVADCSCIAMGVLTTAVRCMGADKDYLLQSVEKFAKIVMDNYIGPSGGICNGGWSEFKGEWWCSSGLFGSLLFMLYETTGNQKYLDTAMRNINWLNKEDLTKAKPFPIEEQGPSMAMYFLEAYSAGWPFVIKDEKVKNDAVKKLGWCLDWIKTQQQVPIQSRKWKPTEWWGSKFGGLPFYEFVFSKYLPEQADLKTNGDRELKQLTEIVLSKKLFKAQLTMFMMFSYAERLKQGDLYRMNIKYDSKSQVDIENKITSDLIMRMKSRAKSQVDLENDIISGLIKGYFIHKPQDTLFNRKGNVKKIRMYHRPNILIIKETDIKLFNKKDSAQTFQRTGLTLSDLDMYSDFLSNNKTALSIDSIKNFDGEITYVPKDTIDNVFSIGGWNKYIQIYGNKFLIRLSRPGVNLSKNKAFMYFSSSFGELGGAGYYVVLEKINKAWIIKTIEMDWIS